MKSLIKTGSFSIMLFISFLAFAGEGDVAKVIIVKGSAKAKFKNNKVVTLKKGDWIPEGVQVKTEAKSFIKLLFIDKSQMNLGPNSQMVINKFPKKKAGIITLMKGQLRSKVSKNYMQMDEGREKLYIKTKTAAMGVRGTDFEVSFSDGVTATNLYEGSLVVTSISEEMSPQAVQKMFLNPNSLTPLSAGQMAVFKGSSAPPAVIKIPQNVMKEALKSGGKKGDLKTLLDKNVRISSGNNLLLPGTSKKDVANTSAGERSVGNDTEKKPRGPASTLEKDSPVTSSYEGPAAGCPLSGCAGTPTGELDPLTTVIKSAGSAAGGRPPAAVSRPMPENPCVADPSICEVVPEVADICSMNAELPQCGGGAATSTNVKFNFKVQ